MPTSTMTKSDIYTFDFCKFRADVLENRTYADLASDLHGGGCDIAIHTVNKKVNGKSKFGFEELLEWCSILDMNPVEYIQMNEENIQ